MYSNYEDRSRDSRVLLRFWIWAICSLSMHYFRLFPYLYLSLATIFRHTKIVFTRLSALMGSGTRC